jgi:RNA polymerase sigma factor (sigma-70 family)
MAATAEQLEALYRERYDVFERVLTGMLRDRERARDAVQEAFARALAKKRSYRGDGPLERWVWRIAVRSGFDARKEEPRLGPFRSDVARAVASSNGRVDERHAALLSALHGLPQRQRLVIFLRYFADLPYDEIATICGVAEGTVGATLSHARAALVGLLEEEGVEAL